MIKWQKHKEFGTGVLYLGPAGHPGLWISLWIKCGKLEFGVWGV
jgi:hypothetical protein